MADLKLPASGESSRRAGCTHVWTGSGAIGAMTPCSKGCGLRYGLRNGRVTCNKTARSVTDFGSHAAAAEGAPGAD